VLLIVLIQNLFQCRGGAGGGRERAGERGERAGSGGRVAVEKWRRDSLHNNIQPNDNQQNNFKKYDNGT
jgi:hypothetical protein